MIYVTHDQVEAMTLADKIVVLRDGRVEQVGAPVDLYENPKNTFVAQFIGSPKMNFFAPANLAETAPAELRNAGHDNRIVGIRPEHLRVCDASEAIVQAKLDLIEHLGEHVLAHMVCADGTEFIAKMEKPPVLEGDATISFNAGADVVHQFDKDSGLRL